MVIEGYTDKDRAEDYEALRQVFIQYLEGALIHGDFNISLEVVSNNVVGTGMGEQGAYFSKDEIREIYDAITKSPSKEETKYALQYGKIDIRFFSHDCASINGEVYLKAVIGDKEMTNSFIQIASAVKENGVWQLFMIMATPIALTQDGINAMPVAFADNALASLKGELQTETFDLMNESFSGGILGTYIKENYPLYFANDAFISMLGYERNEFEETFKDNTVMIGYSKDAKYICEASEKNKSVDIAFSSHHRLVKKDGTPIWVESRVRKTKDDYGNDIFLSVVVDINEIVELQQKTVEQNETIMAGIEYASKIQKNLLPLDSVMEKAFSDYSVIWKPRDVVGGDIYWIKLFETGTVLVVADCTGHGTPGALLTMLVISALENVVLPGNCHDTAEIIWGLEQRLVEVFNVKEDGRTLSAYHINDGCDLAVLFIANDGNITLSAGHTNVYVCDGKEVERIRGQKLYVGEGKINGKDEIKTVHIPYNPDNKFYIASDGLSDQLGWEDNSPFGYRKMGKIALANHNKPLSEITNIVWATFEEHRGNTTRLDDFELVAFKP